MKTGSAMLLTLLFITAVALMVGGLASRVVVGGRAVAARTDRAAALATAYAAVTRTRFRLSLSADWTASPPDALFTDEPFSADGLYTVTLAERTRDAVTAVIDARWRASRVLARARIRRNTDWWDFNWTRRRPIIITNSSSQDLVDYQVRIVVPRHQGMRADYGDMRFVAGGSTLPYWVEYSDANSAVVWVRVPGIPANSTATVYLYYGNPSATGQSSFAATMEPVYNCYPVSIPWTNRPDNNPYMRALREGRTYTLPWRFPYWGQFKDEVYITTLGYLLFQPTPYQLLRNNSTDGMSSRQMVAAFWDDTRADVVFGVCENPGVYVYQQNDRLFIDWEVVHYLYWWRRVRASMKFQVFLYRCGDIRLVRGVYGGRPSPTLGVSRGDGTYIDVTGQWRARTSWLFAQRKYVEPEPTAATGAEEYAATSVITDWTESHP